MKVTYNPKVKEKIVLESSSVSQAYKIGGRYFKSFLETDDLVMLCMALRNKNFSISERGVVCHDNHDMVRSLIEEVYFGFPGSTYDMSILRASLKDKGYCISKYGELCHPNPTMVYAITEIMRALKY